MEDLLDYFTPGSEFDRDIFLGENNMSGVENVLDAPLLTPPQASMLDNLVNTPSTSNNNNNNNNNSIMDNSQNIVGPSQPPVQPSNVIKKKKKDVKPIGDIDSNFETPSARVSKRLMVNTPSPFSEPYESDSSSTKVVKKSKLTRPRRRKVSNGKTVLNMPIGTLSSTISVERTDNNNSVNNNNNDNGDISASVSSQGVTPYQHNHIENESDHIIPSSSAPPPEAPASHSKTVDENISESLLLDSILDMEVQQASPAHGFKTTPCAHSTPIQPSNVSSLPLNNNNNNNSSIELPPPSQGKMANECSINHKSSNMQTIRKMESAYNFSKSAADTEKQTSEFRRDDQSSNNNKHKGSYNVYHSKVHYIESRGDLKHPTTVLVVRNSSNGNRLIPNVVFLNGNNNNSSTSGINLTPKQFIELCNIVDKFLGNDLMTHYVTGLSKDLNNTALSVKLDRYTIKVISFDNGKPTKTYAVNFDTFKQMNAYLLGLKDLSLLIQHKINLPIAKNIFQAKVDEMFDACNCSDKGVILSNLSYLYYHYVNVYPLPYHLSVNKHLFDFVEKYVL